MRPLIPYQECREIHVLVHRNIVCRVDTEHCFTVFREHFALPIALDHKGKDVGRKIRTSRRRICFGLEAKQLAFGAEIFHPAES